MATRGVFQLTRLRLYYCEHGGSSQALRDYIGSGRLAAWASARPHVAIEVAPRNGRHPFITGDYRTQASTHQVSVRNYENWKQVEEVMDMLANRSGRKLTKITKPVLTDTPSIQGVWTPFLDLSQAEFKVTIHEE